MRPLQFLAVSALSAGLVVGCSPPLTGATSTTAAAVSTASSPPSPETAEAAEVPAGELACRTTSVTEGTSELYLDWSGEVAKGVLRRVVPSGMVYVLPVRAERYKGAIIADAPAETDLVCHQAVVGQQDGKKYMRVGDRQQPWTLCD